MPEIYVARQPIYDEGLRAHGYELLFRGGPAGLTDGGGIVDGDQATSQVIVNTFTEIGFERLVGRRRAFVNITRAFATGSLPLPFPPDRTVLEVLETIDIDEEVVAVVRHLAGSGYAIALDDVGDDLATHPLLPIATYVKIDVRQHDEDMQRELLAVCRTHPRVQTIAEKVETREEFAAAQALGFTYFQGFFLSRPNLVGSRSLSPRRFAFMDLLAKLSQPECGFEDIEASVRLDVGLSYRVLRAVNSADFGLRRKISSLREAMVMLGLERLRSWVLLMAVADTGDTSEEQLSTAMTRARMCELLARKVGVRPDVAFTTGMLSSLDFLLDVPLADVVAQLPLEQELEDALLRHTGPLGQLLAAVGAYERDEPQPRVAPGVDLSDLGNAYLSAVGWSLQTYESVLAS